MQVTDTTRWAHELNAAAQAVETWKARAERAERQAEALAKAVGDALRLLNDMQYKAPEQDPGWYFKKALQTLDAAVVAYREGK